MLNVFMLSVVVPCDNISFMNEAKKCDTKLRLKKIVASKLYSRQLYFIKAETKWNSIF